MSKIETVALANVPVLVTASASAPADGTVIETPEGQPNVEVVQMSWYAQVGVRVLRTYLQSLLGFLLAMGSGAADAVGIKLPAADFGQLMIQSASLALAPAAISLIQNAVEILTKMDGGRFRA